MTRKLLEYSGIGGERLQLRWVSAAEGQEFARSVCELSEVVRGLGPVDRSRFGLHPSVLAQTFGSVRLRWLLGMKRRLTELGNVCNEKIDKRRYEEILGAAALEECHKALILEWLKKGPQSVREVAAGSGLPVYTISRRLGDVEKAGKAAFHSFEGETPRFIRVGAYENFSGPARCRPVGIDICEATLLCQERLMK